MVRLLLSAQEVKKSLLYNLVSEKQKLGTSFADAVIFDNKSIVFMPGNSILSSSASLQLDKKTISNIFISQPAGLRLQIPVSQFQRYTLVLLAQAINNSGDFSFGTISNYLTVKTSADQGLHYRGYIEGDSSSLACVSIFNNGEVMGVFSNREGNFIIGRMNQPDTSYIVYESSDMRLQPRYPCGTTELTQPAMALNEKRLSTTPVVANTPPVLCKKVKLYWEADYKLYSYNFQSNLTRVRNYLTGLFNIVSTLYQNEGIQVELSKTYIWTTADPYSNANSNQGLTTFKSRWNALGNNYGADLAHLIAGGSTNNGGVAFLLDFDQCNRPYTYGYSNVYGTYQSYPNYSWDAMVLTHEIGHNLGSHHTHWCGWNTGADNTCGAIDNCAAEETGSTCTTCPATTDINALPPGFKGTIMSYCYLNNGTGVSFVNGFGPLPQAAIRSNVSAATCFTSTSTWTGNVNTAWENTGNWSCGIVPTSTTDVIINGGLSNYPVVNSVATCRSIKQAKGTSIKINASFKLSIMGKPGS